MKLGSPKMHDCCLFLTHSFYDLLSRSLSNLFISSLSLLQISKVFIGTQRRACIQLFGGSAHTSTPSSAVRCVLPTFVKETLPMRSRGEESLASSSNPISSLFLGDIPLPAILTSVCHQYFSPTEASSPAGYVNSMPP